MHTPRENESPTELAARLQRQHAWWRYSPYLRLCKQLRHHSHALTTADGDPVSRARAVMADEDWEVDPSDARTYVVPQTPMALAERIDKAEHTGTETRNGAQERASSIDAGHAHRGRHVHRADAHALHWQQGGSGESSTSTAGGETQTCKTRRPSPLARFALYEESGTDRYSIQNPRRNHGLPSSPSSPATHTSPQD